MPSTRACAGAELGKRLRYRHHRHRRFGGGDGAGLVRHPLEHPAHRRPPPHRAHHRCAMGAAGRNRKQPAALCRDRPRRSSAGDGTHDPAPWRQGRLHAFRAALCHRDRLRGLHSRHPHPADRNHPRRGCLLQAGIQIAGTGGGFAQRPFCDTGPRPQGEALFGHYVWQIKTVLAWGERARAALAGQLGPEAEKNAINSRAMGPSPVSET